MRNVLLISWNL